jgi:hypothetical protein
MNVTYEQALKRGEQAGARKANEEEFLALICKSLASLHAISPALVYEGAKKRRLTAKQVAKLAEDDPVALGDLMFV